MSSDATGVALSMLNKLAGAEILDKLGLRKQAEKLVYLSTRSGIRLASSTEKAISKAGTKATATARRFKSVNNNNKATRLITKKNDGIFDLNLTEEQQMVSEMIQRFAMDTLRPAAHEANEKAQTPQFVFDQANELGLNSFAIPEAMGGAGTEHSVVTNMLVAEGLARGDMGLTVSILSSLGVANALTHWGTGDQQQKYLPAFLDENTIKATIAVNEPSTLFDPKQLKTHAREQGSDYVINGLKSLVALSQDAELFLVAADTEALGPRIFIIEGGTPGLSIKTDNAMGQRAANLGTLHLDNVKVPREALLGTELFNYQNFINFAHLGWCALAVGTCQAVLDYVIPYVNEREAFGEPISHRQSVAFTIANMGIELEGMRLLLYRGASRAEAGEDFHREAYLARIFCADKAMQIGTDGVQLLGGHGYTCDFPVERWYRDLRAVAIMDGTLHL